MRAGSEGGDKLSYLSRSVANSFSSVAKDSMADVFFAAKDGAVSVVSC